MCNHSHFHFLLLFLLLDEHIYQLSTNLNGVLKIFIVKSSIGLYVLQGIIEDILVASKSLEIGDTDRYTSEERAQRALGNTIHIYISCNMY